MREDHYGFDRHHREAVAFTRRLQPGEAGIYPRRMPKAMARALQQQMEADGFTKNKGYHVLYIPSELDVEKTAV